MLRVVFFDLGGTLAHPSPSFHGLLAQVCQAHGLEVTAADAARVEPAVWARIARREHEARGFSLSAERSRAFWIWVYQTFLDELSLEPEDGVVEALLHTFSQPSSYQLYEDALPALKSLHQSGLCLGIISNWEAWAEAMLEELQIRQYFDCTVISGTSGFEKPGPEIFLKALELAGAHPAEAVHVGDDPRRDVEAAERVGIMPVLLDRTGDSRVVPPAAFDPRRASESVTPTAPRNGLARQIRSLRELPALLAHEPQR